MRDHGGNLDAARAQFGDGDWIDLSTGINRVPYPLPALPARAWTDLPTQDDMDALMRAARAAWRTDAPGLPLAGAQAAIQMVPLLAAPGRARVLSPTYNEHAGALSAMGWQVDEVTRAEALHGADLAIIVNPNNPDGHRLMPDAVMALADRVGRLIVDESFADAHPELSVLPRAGRSGLIVLRSFGKFYGLAGMRLGFAFADAATVARLRELSGPWPVSGAAIATGQAALADPDWARATRNRLQRDVARMDDMAQRIGWQVAGGTALFRLYDTGDALAAQTRLARGYIWSRLFPWSDRLLRLGLPGSADEWDRLDHALRG